MISGCYKVYNAQETQALAATVAESVKGGTLLLLEGELGSGKTTFVQGLARALGVKDNVTSPTFTIVCEYRLAVGSMRTFVHADLYRLPKQKAAEDWSLLDVIERAGEKDRLTVIEWSERLEDTALGRKGKFDEKKGIADSGGKAGGDQWRIKFAHGQSLEERTIIIEPR
jgi:tRNA threonylcarbamoyl adenosine modification protein YjeE